MLEEYKEEEGRNTELDTKDMSQWGMWLQGTWGT